MSKAVGYTCDGPNCSTFVASNDSRLPAGWMVLVIYSEQDRTEGRFELCSNRCVRQLAQERERAERGDDPPPSGGRRAVGHRTQHVAKGIVNPECEFCIQETAPPAPSNVRAVS